MRSSGEFDNCRYPSSPASRDRCSVVAQRRHPNRIARQVRSPVRPGMADTTACAFPRTSKGIIHRDSKGRASPASLDTWRSARRHRARLPEKTSSPPETTPRRSARSDRDPHGLRYSESLRQNSLGTHDAGQQTTPKTIAAANLGTPAHCTPSSTSPNRRVNYTRECYPDRQTRARDGLSRLWCLCEVLACGCAGSRANRSTAVYSSRMVISRTSGSSSVASVTTSILTGSWRSNRRVSS